MRQRVVGVPQAIDQLAYLLRTTGIVAGDIAEPPVANARHLFQQIRLEVDHPVAPAVSGFGFAGMQLIGIHGNDGMDGGNVLRSAIAKAFGTGFNGADTKGLVGVRLKGVA